VRLKIDWLFFLILSLFLFCEKLRLREIDWFFFYYLYFYFESANKGNSLKTVFFSCYFYYYFFYSWILLSSIYIYFLFKRLLEKNWVLRYTFKKIFFYKTLSLNVDYYNINIIKKITICINFSNILIENIYSIIYIQAQLIIIYHIFTSKIVLIIK